MRLALLALFCAACNACSQGVATEPAAAPSAPVQSPDGCASSCQVAQSACPKPATVEHCIAQCTAAAANLTGASLDCFALVATCNVECKP